MILMHIFDVEDVIRSMRKNGFHGVGVIRHRADSLIRGLRVQF